MPLLWLPKKIPGQRNAQQCHSLRCLSLTRLIENFEGTVFPSLYKPRDLVSMRNEMFKFKKKKERNMSPIAILTTAHVSLTLSNPRPSLEMNG